MDEIRLKVDNEQKLLQTLKLKKAKADYMDLNGEEKEMQRSPDAEKTILEESIVRKLKISNQILSGVFNLLSKL